jgi:hypothetical protein
MAIITLKITVRRAEGPNKVHTLEIAQNLAQIVEELDAFEVEDVAGEDATYEVTKVTIVMEQLDLIKTEPLDITFCRWCKAVLPSVEVGRPREFCSDAHRQADYRHRHNLA